MKASSQEASGRFPAQISVVASAPGVPSSLRMEATNLLGGVEAVISVDGKKYSVTVPGHPERGEKGTQSWAGIPLEWATDLFLGKVPCPESVALADARVSLSPEGELSVETKPTLAGDRQKFTYRLTYRGSQPWPERLHWEKQGFSAAVVDFQFFGPESSTQSPTRWEAKSSYGEVKVSWKDRDVH